MTEIIITPPSLLCQQIIQTNSAYLVFIFKIVSDQSYIVVPQVKEASDSQ